MDYLDSILIRLLKLFIFYAIFIVPAISFIAFVLDLNGMLTPKTMKLMALAGMILGAAYLIIQMKL